MGLYWGFGKAESVRGALQEQYLNEDRAIDHESPTSCLNSTFYQCRIPMRGSSDENTIDHENILNNTKAG